MAYRTEGMLGGRWLAFRLLRSSSLLRCPSAHNKRDILRLAVRALVSDYSHGIVPLRVALRVCPGTLLASA